MALANEIYKQKRLVHLFDSFMGIPMAGEHDDESITSCIGKPPEGNKPPAKLTGDEPLALFHIQMLEKQH